MKESNRSHRDTINRTYLYILLILTPINVFAQEESLQCREANTELKLLFSGGTIDRLSVNGCSGSGLHSLSSSYLKASGNAPKIIDNPEGPPEDTDFVAWTCKYSVGNITDNNPATAWVEGVVGDGLGEVVIVPCLDLMKPVKIWAGFGKSDKLHLSNNRPSQLKLAIIRAEPSAGGIGTDYNNLVVIAEGVVELNDVNAYQLLKIPHFKFETYKSKSQTGDFDYEYLLGVEILKVYKGNKWDDTCISEIRNE